MNNRSLSSRLIACRILNFRVRRYSIISTTRSTFSNNRSQTERNRIRLQSVTNSSRHNIRTRANRRRLRLLFNNILDLIRSRRHIIRHATTRMNRQHRFSKTIIRMPLRLINTRRITGHIMRQTRVQIGLIVRHTKRGTRTFTNLRNQTHRSSTTGLLILRNARDLNRNRVHLTNTYKTGTRNSNIQFSNIRMNRLSNNFHASQRTNDGNSSTKGHKLTMHQIIKTNEAYVNTLI